MTFDFDIVIEPLFGRKKNNQFLFTSTYEQSIKLKVLTTYNTLLFNFFHIQFESQLNHRNFFSHRFNKNKMKFFQVVRENLVIYGIASQQHPFNVRNWLGLLIFGFGTISNGVYCVCEATTFQEYADSLFVAVACFDILMIFLYSVLFMQKIFVCLDHAEEIINCSKYDLFLSTSGTSLISNGIVFIFSLVNVNFRTRIC